LGSILNLYWALQLENYKNRQNVEAESWERINYFTDAKSINGVQNQMYIEKRQKVFWKHWINNKVDKR
jgi:hypothetical protein